MTEYKPWSDIHLVICNSVEYENENTEQKTIATFITTLHYRKYIHIIKLQNMKLYKL